jgi:hypothetical protein
MLKRHVFSSLVACVLSVAPVWAHMLSHGDYVIFLDSHRESLFDYARGKGLTLKKVSSNPAQRAEEWKADEAEEAFPVVGMLHGATFELKFDPLYGTDRTQTVRYRDTFKLSAGQTATAYIATVLNGFSKTYGEPVYKTTDAGGKSFANYDLGDMFLCVGLSPNAGGDPASVGFIAMFNPHKVLK